MQTTSFSRIAAAATLVLLTATAARGQTPPPVSDTQRLQGGWVMTVIRDPSAPVLPPVQPGVFVMLFTAEGGVMSQQNNVFPPGLLSTGGAGAWERVSKNTFAVTQRFAVAYVDAVGGHPSNIIVQRLLVHYEASSNEMAGTADWAVLDLDGNVLFSEGFAVTLQRVSPQLVGSPF
jgi:hypothetical protein